MFCPPRRKLISLTILLDSEQFHTPSSVSTSSSQCTPSPYSSSSSSSGSATKKKKLAAFSTIETAVAAPAPTCPTQVVTVLRVCTKLDDETYATVALVFDKAYHMRDDLQHPPTPFPIPIIYWKLQSRKNATAKLSKVASGLATGHGLYIAIGITEDIEELQERGNLLDQMLREIKTLDGVTREGYLIRLNVIKTLADEVYQHSLIKLEEYAAKNFYPTLNSPATSSTEVAPPAVTGGLTILEE
jgi:hypothetical protein